MDFPEGDPPTPQTEVNLVWYGRSGKLVFSQNEAIYFLDDFRQKMGNCRQNFTDFFQINRNKNPNLALALCQGVQGGRSGVSPSSFFALVTSDVSCASNLSCCSFSCATLALDGLAGKDLVADIVGFCTIFVFLTDFRGKIALLLVLYRILLRLGVCKFAITKCWRFLL